MADLTTISDFPPRTVIYNPEFRNAITRTDQRGFKRQARYSQSQTMIVDVSRVLSGSQLPYFESFVHGQIDYGRDAYTDRYKDGSGVQSGTVRIVNGKYEVETIGINHTVRCQIEVFR